MGKKRIKWNIGKVKKYFKDRDCELLETEYKNCTTKMRYRCKCGNKECKISFDKFKKGHRCIECGGSKKLTFEYVKQYFEDHDCELLETEYINCMTKMKYRCKCGNDKCSISFNSFKRGHRCMECSGCEKLTFDYVKQYFEDHDCELLEKEYKNITIPMKYRCSCGNRKCKISFNSFQRGTRCMECGRKKQAKNHCHTFEDVKKYFEDHDCELLETEYIGCMIPMKYRCSCGNSDCKICFNNFKNGARCMECAVKKRANKKRFLFKDVKQYFEDHDCELLETEYINSKTLMRYRCSCENSKCKITFSRFKQGSKCMECSGSKKYTYEEVYNYFKEHDCELLATEYINNHTPMKYECSCGNSDYKISFSSFKQGHRCKKCAAERNSGKNHPLYNPNLTDEEREKGRICPGLGKWKKDVRKRDNNTCQYCGETEGKLCAHHIEAYTPNKELRTVLSNGFLFCEKHHKEFHKKYGKNCNREQLEEYLSTRNLIFN